MQKNKRRIEAATSFCVGVNLTTINVVLVGVVMILGIGAIYVLSLPDKTSPAEPPSEVIDIYSPPEEDTANAAGHDTPHKIYKIQPSSHASTNTKNAQFIAGSYGDWGGECVTVLDNTPECHLFQRILWDDTKEEALLAHLFWTQRAGKPVLRLRLIAPLGTYLPSGMLLRLEGDKEFVAQFQYCVGGGCFVNLDLADDVIAAMHKAKMLHVAYQQLNGTVGSVQVSLIGFENGLRALKELNE